MKRAALAAAIGIAVMASVTLLGPAAAQVAPGTEQAARYTGLHAAAHRGDLAALDKLLAARPDAAVLNARDAHGRTPVHVAAFARQREALRRLARAGADLGALENDRYDAVTIAAVADDEDTLRTLLALGASARLTTSRYDGTALIAAAHLGHDGVVRQLIAAGAQLAGTVHHGGGDVVAGGRAGGHGGAGNLVGQVQRHHTFAANGLVLGLGLRHAGGGQGEGGGQGGSGVAGEVFHAGLHQVRLGCLHCRNRARTAPFVRRRAALRRTTEPTMPNRARRQRLQRCLPLPPVARIAG